MATDHEPRQGAHLREEDTPTDTLSAVASGGSYSTDGPQPSESDPAAEQFAREGETPPVGPVGFDTMPGGGNNRLSGGRKAARAYVRPKTPPPRRTGRHDTVSVDVDASVGVESRAFPTSPSLYRRRNSEAEMASLPPLSYPPARRFPWWTAVATGIVSAAVLIGVWQWVVPSRNFSPSAPTPASTTPASSSTRASIPLVQPRPADATTSPPTATAVPHLPAARPAAAAPPPNHQKSVPPRPSASAKPAEKPQAASSTATTNPFTPVPAPKSSPPARPHSPDTEVWLE